MLDSPYALLIGGGIALGAIVVASVAIYRWLHRQPAETGPPVDSLSIDLGKFPAQGPGNMDSDLPSLHVYGTPVRLVVAVLASSGRGQPIPGVNMIGPVLESIVPGLGTLIENHQSLQRVWPSQLSSHGFEQSFFNRVALPGDRGKDTPWCSMAGKVRFQDRTFLVGLVGFADRNNSLSQISIQHEGQWLDVLRIQTS